uniref:Uncharacterized protein n=1 Tax=Anguilla anguilla TaxID=7936 RepID=A0A0E9W155_ANGAN
MTENQSNKSDATAGRPGIGRLAFRHKQMH